jgi:hypothetical protein
VYGRRFGTCTSRDVAHDSNWGFPIQTELLESNIIQPLDGFSTGHNWGLWALKSVASVVSWGYHQVMATHDIPQVSFDYYFINAHSWPE